MAFVYILKSNSLDRYYIGSCLDLAARLQEHLAGIYQAAYTHKASDWVLLFSIEGLGYDQARKIEAHIKRMKSKKYIENLFKYPEMVRSLVERYGQQAT
jgi:putative endonuclease